MADYKRQPRPRFKEGDKVVDFRGRTAVVTHSYESRDWHSKSHRVEVHWDDDKVPAATLYYEEVFEPLEEDDDNPEL